MDFAATWHLWSADDFVGSLPGLLDIVAASLDDFGEEHRSKNQAALQSLRDAPITPTQLREGTRLRELTTIAFALDLMGRKLAAAGRHEESLPLFRAAHELFRGGNAALRATAPMRQTLTNALRVIIPLEVKRAVSGETDAGDIRDRVERLITSAWGAVPPQLSLTLNETLLTELERRRVEGEHDVAFHDRFVRDNIEAVLRIEIPARLESVREKWEEIGQHVAPAAVRVAQRNLRRPEALSSLLLKEAWETIRRAVERGDVDALASALSSHDDALETNLRLRLDARAEYREPAVELRHKGGPDRFFLEARDLLLRRDARALEKFSNIHYHKSNNAIAKEWYAYALAVFGSGIDIHEIVTLLQDAIRSDYSRWTARWNLAAALRKLSDRSDEALDVLLPVLDEDAHSSEVFELCLLWALEQHRDDALGGLYLRSPYYEAHLLAALRDAEAPDSKKDALSFAPHFRRLGRILRDPDRVFPDPKENLSFRELDQLTRDFVETSLVESGVEWFRQRVSYGNESNIFKNWECAALLNEKSGDMRAAWRCRERQWSVTERSRKVDPNTKASVLRGLLGWAQRFNFHDEALRVLRRTSPGAVLSEADLRLWEQRLRRTESASPSLESSRPTQDPLPPAGGKESVRPPTPVEDQDPEAVIQAAAGAFSTVSAVEALATLQATALRLLRATERKHPGLGPALPAALRQVLELAASANNGVDEPTAKLIADRLREQLAVLQTSRASAPYELHGLVQACERVIQNFTVRAKTVPDLVITPPAALRLSLGRPQDGEQLKTRIAVRVSNPGREPLERLQLTFMTPAPSVQIAADTSTIESMAPAERRIVECEAVIDSSVGEDVEVRVHATYAVANVQRSVHASGRIPVIPTPDTIPVAIRYMTLAPVEPERVDLFHGRDRELTELASVFAGGRLRRLYFVNGIRRVGKSTLMKNLGPRCGDQVLALMFSLETLLEGQRLTTVQLVRQLIRSALDQLKRAKIAPTTPLAVPGADAFALDPPWTVLDDFLEQLRTATGKGNILVCFDEVQRLVERIADPNDPIDDGFLSWLRGKIQTGSDLLVACTGSEPFSTMRARYQHTLWGNMEPYNISFVDREAMGLIAATPVQQDGVLWLPESLDMLWDMTEGHPWIVQILAEKAVEGLNSERRRFVTPDDVSRAASRVAASSHVSDLWWNESEGCVTSTHRQIAFLILQHQPQPGGGVPEVRLAELCQWSGIRSPGKFFDEMRSLEVLTEVKDEGEPRWRIRGRFLESHLEVLRQRALQEAGPGASSDATQRPLALMLDWENVKIGLLELLRGLPEVKTRELQKTVDAADLSVRLLNAAAKHGTPRQRWAVADWDKATFKGDQKAFKNARYWTDIAGVDKANASDHVLLEKLHFVLRQHPEISVYVIGTGDGDFHEAIKTLQEQGKQVILWSTRASLNRAYGESLRGPDQIQIEWLEDIVFGEATGADGLPAGGAKTSS